MVVCLSWCLFLAGLWGHEEKELFTEVFVVPPTLLSGQPTPQEWAEEDPFSDFRPSQPQKTARQVLVEAGISFGDGTSAIYNPVNSQLIVRNTRAQIDLVKAYIESLIQGVEKQIYITVREIGLNEKALESVLKSELDWLVSRPEGMSTPPQGRSGVWSYRSFLEELSRPPKILEEETKFSKGVAGVFTDPQFQVAIRAINQVQGVDLLSLPSVMVRSGQPGLIQVGEKRIGVIATLGADEFTVDLAIFLPEDGKALFQPGEDLKTPLKVTIWDGQTVVCSTWRGETLSRLVFVKAALMDPAGKPINPEGGEASRPGLRIPKPVLPAEPEKTDEIDTDAVAKADDLALRASQQMADGAFVEAVHNYGEALEILPMHELTEKRRKAYTKQETLARLELVKRSWESSIPGGPSYLVKSGDTLYGIATDAGISVSRIIDLNRLDSETVDPGQILILPENTEATSGLRNLLKTKVIPSLEFEETPLFEALGYVQRALLERNENALFPLAAPKLMFEGPDSLAETKITLRLANVPATEALRYITSLAQCQYEIEGMQITVSPLEESSGQ
ncbi:MAG: LysM peptidoglycan-binding domain-containing protein [Verrucomicrobiota bacterium]